MSVCVCSRQTATFYISVKTEVDLSQYMVRKTAHELLLYPEIL